MPTWNNNNLACINVWSTLYIMKEHRKTFKKAEGLTMSELNFFNPLLTKPELEFVATSIADFLDTVFKNTYRAKYEENVTKAKAVENMVRILTNAKKSIPDLAAIIDDDYNF